MVPIQPLGQSRVVITLSMPSALKEDLVESPVAESGVT